jgi:hypothetical protein
LWNSAQLVLNFTYLSQHWYPAQHRRPNSYHKRCNIKLVEYARLRLKFFIPSVSCDTPTPNARLTSSNPVHMPSVRQRRHEHEHRS